MKDEEVHELLYQALETELGGVQVYQTALRCAVNDDLKKEWEEYLEQTQNHVRIVENVFARLELDPEAETPGRLVVRHIGESLVKAMEMALDGGKPEAARDRGGRVRRARRDQGPPELGADRRAREEGRRARRARR